MITISSMRSDRRLALQRLGEVGQGTESENPHPGLILETFDQIIGGVSGSAVKRPEA